MHISLQKKQVGELHIIIAVIYFVFLFVAGKNE